MNEHRPSPLALAELLRGLAQCHRELESHTVNRPSGSGGERVDTSEGVEKPAPGHWTAIAIRADIHHFAYAHAKMLVDDRSVNWSKLPATTEGLLELIAMFPGYFADHDNVQIAYTIQGDINDLIGRARAALEPANDAHRTPIGPCVEQGCRGEYRVHWREGEGDEASRVRRFKDSRPVGKCTEDPAHKVDVMLYGAGRA